jgi:creatinine amidohydrolase
MSARIVHRWDESTRTDLSRILPEALVLIATGAVEQHGPHLPTGTDSLLARTILERAADLAAPNSTRELVMAPVIQIGASDHHLPFGGTVSLAPRTMLAVLGDVLRSVALAGARRILIVNGHGGNTGVCHVAAAAATASGDVSVGCLDYWQLAPADAPGPVPGHAGRFETSLVLAVRPELVADRADRPEPAAIVAPGSVDLHSAAAWAAIDGYTDHPEQADAEIGRRILEDIVSALSVRIAETAGVL